MDHRIVTLTFNALSNQTPHVVSAEVAPVRPFECVHLQWHQADVTQRHSVAKVTIFQYQDRQLVRQIEITGMLTYV